MSTSAKLYGLLTSAERKGAVVLVGLMLIGMLLETAGIGLVIPTLAVMSQGDLATRYPSLAPWLIRLGNPRREQLIIGAALLLVSTALIKALFLGYVTWRQSRFVFAFQSELSERMFTGYLRQPYTFHLQRNSAQLIRTIIGQVDEIRGVVQAVVLLLAELMVLFGILALLFVVEPTGTLLVLVTLALAGWGFQGATRVRLLKWGNARQLHEGMRIQHLQQGLGGVKDVILLGREAEFIEQYRAHNDGNARVGERQATLQALPRLWLEFLSAMGLSTLILVMIVRGRPVDALLPTLGLFAAAAFRLMPSVIRVINTAQTVRFSLPVIDSMHSELALLDAGPTRLSGPSLPFRSALALDGVSFRYPGADQPALRSVSLTIVRGSSVGFVGTTGAGKSTLVDAVLGLLTPDDGRVTVDGVNTQTNLRGWQRHIGYVPQTIFLTDDTLRRNIAFGLGPHQIDDAAVWRAIDAAQLRQFVTDLPQGLETVVGERGIRLSGGERQRIGIARALYHDPDVLVLDEATSSLDTATERGVVEAVRALQGDKTVLIVAHRLSTVAHCDRVFRLERGSLVAEGDTASMLAARS